MNDYPACEVPRGIVRDAGVRTTCYPLKGNQPAGRRKGPIFTVDASIRNSDGALSEVSIPDERLRPGPTGALFAIDATDAVSRLTRSLPDLDRPGGAIFGFDQGDPETHCRNAYFAAMATYEAFRKALGRPVAWAFWEDGAYPPLRLVPFAFEGINAYYDRERGEIGFGFGSGDATSDRADRRLMRFTALSSDVVTHEVTHALIDGLRPGYDFPVNSDVFAFHEALADVVALLSRFSRPGYFTYLVRMAGIDFLNHRTLVSLAPELGQLVRRSGLRTLDVDWTTPSERPRPRDSSSTAPRPSSRTSGAAFSPPPSSRRSCARSTAGSHRWCGSRDLRTAPSGGR